MRVDGRGAGQLRRVRMTADYTKYAEGSVLMEMGDTKVICNASVEVGVPPFLRDSGKGWVTAEYAMLPRATGTRSRRDISSLKLNGRAAEIQRLIGRALRSVTDLTALTPTDTLRIRADSIRRVTDNVIDNLVKYADRAHPVTVTATRTQAELTVSISNAVGRKSDKTSSTRIGVKTCVNMMKMMNGSFVTRTEDGIFTASLSLPLSEMK